MLQPKKQIIPIDIIAEAFNKLDKSLVLSGKTRVSEITKWSQQKINYLLLGKIPISENDKIKLLNAIKQAGKEMKKDVMLRNRTIQKIRK